MWNRNLPFSPFDINHDISLPRPCLRKVFWYGFSAGIITAALLFWPPQKRHRTDYPVPHPGQKACDGVEMEVF
jgi:hypothetical protein